MAFVRLPEVLADQFEYDWMFPSYSSSESEGGILPTVDSSSSESSGYAEALTNSFGLIAASATDFVTASLYLPIRLFPPHMFIANNVQDLPIEFILPYICPLGIDEHVASTLDPYGVPES